MKFVLILYAVMVITGCSRSESVNRRIPFVAIMAALNEYDGATVHVITYASLQFEGQAAYINESDINLIYSNGLWLNLPQYINEENLNKKGIYEIWGKVDLSQRGHFGLWPGSIQVSKISEYFIYHK